MACKYTVNKNGRRICNAVDRDEVGSGRFIYHINSLTRLDCQPAQDHRLSQMRPAAERISAANLAFRVVLPSLNSEDVNQKPDAQDRGIMRRAR